MEVTTLGCDDGHIITNEGICQQCAAPDLFLIHYPGMVKDLQGFLIEECS
jgi:hypothetical protein